ncbi:hypothetical protein RB594_000345 [Gaeumannomyces avenae]
MPQGENRERRPLLGTEESFPGERRVRRVWDGFLDFALQGNILEIAFGLILAAAFTTIVNSFVSDILLPPLSVLLPLNKNLDEKFAVLKPGPKYDPKHGGYPTIKMAQDDSAVVMAWGSFVNKSLNFLGIGISLYALAGLYQYFSKDPIIKHLRKCPYCRKNINEKYAGICQHMPSNTDSRRDRCPSPSHPPRPLLSSNAIANALCPSILTTRSLVGPGDVSTAPAGSMAPKISGTRSLLACVEILLLTTRRRVLDRQRREDESILRESWVYFKRIELRGGFFFFAICDL